MPTLRELFLTHNAQTSKDPLLLEVARAEGIYLYDANEKAYIDLIAGIGVCNLGHSHPKVVAAVQHQAEQYMHLMVYGEYVQKPQTLFAKKLATVLPPSLSSIYFVNSGSEAIEGAIKLAKRYTGRWETVAFYNSYHGSTQGALSVMGQELFKQSYRPLIPGVKFIRINELKDLGQITSKTACVLLETIQAEAGVQIPTEDYLYALRQRCYDTGSLLILDEAQTAFGRTGTLFAFEHLTAVPDILVLAKSLGGGMPLGAFVASANKMSVLKSHPPLGHISTFGGHPVSCAAGLAALEVLLEEQWMVDVPKKEALFRALLQHAAIKAIRGKGLLLAIEFESFNFNKKVINYCIQKSVVTDWFLHCSHAMRIAPPLIITEEAIHQACSVVLEAIDFSQREKSTRSIN